MAVNRRRSSRSKKSRRSKTRRQRKQRGGELGLLDNADGIPIVNEKQMTFNVKWQPTIKAAIFGPLFTVEQTRPEPQVAWTAPPPSIMYTLIVWDPDAAAKSWLHWLVVNCTGTNPSTGNEMAGWYPPNPPAGSGQHRYVFGLFQQAAMVNLPSISNRAGFNVASFGSLAGLTPLVYTGVRISS